MKTKLYALLTERLDGKEFIEILVSELEAIAGDDWLLEVNEQAQKLSARAEPHPRNPQMAIVSRQVA